MDENAVLESRLRKVEVTGDCWIWTGASSGGNAIKGRYGVVGGGDRQGKKTKLVHRWSFEIFNGPIPDGLEICHTCDVRLCINPDHLFVGTRSDNMRDMVSKGRANPWTRKLSDDQVKDIRRDARTNKAIADDYGINPSSISRIKSGFAYQHVS